MAESMISADVGWSCSVSVDSPTAEAASCALLISAAVRALVLVADAELFRIDWYGCDGHTGPRLGRLPSAAIGSTGADQFGATQSA